MWTFEKLQARFGFITRMQHFNRFVEGWNIIGNNFVEKGHSVIIDTALYNEIIEKYKGVLSKPFFSYKCRYTFYS